MYELLTIQTSPQTSSPSSGDALPIIAIIIAISLFIGTITLGLIALRAIYRFITKQPKEKRMKNCGYCIDSSILCCHDDNHEMLYPASYCPICGRKL